MDEGGPRALSERQDGAAGTSRCAINQDCCFFASRTDLRNGGEGVNGGRTLQEETKGFSGEEAAI